MPIYSYECPQCGHCEEALLSTSEAKNPDAYSIECAHVHGPFGSATFGPPPERMRRVMSLPAQHQMGGVEGKARTAENIKKRNADYWSSGRGKSEHKDNVRAAFKRIRERV